MLTLKDEHLPDGWHVVNPLELIVEKDADGLQIVSDNVSGQYGVGDTLAEALLDYGDCLTAFYEMVEEDAEGNPFDAATLATLRQYLRRA